MKKAVVLLLFVGLVAGLYYWKQTRAPQVSIDEVKETATVQRGPIRQEVEATGRIVSNRDIEIKCRASGEIVKLPFDISDEVKKGDLLLELDPTDQERLMQQSQANLAASEARLAQSENNLVTARKSIDTARLKISASLDAAKARLKDAEAKAKRQEELLAKNFTSPEQSETARTAAVEAQQSLKTIEAQLEDIRVQELELEARKQDINLSKAQLENNKIALNLAQRQLSYTKVFAPIDGVITARTVQIGQIISSGVTNVGGGTTAMVLSDLSRIYLLASVDESNIGMVKLGQTAKVTADAFPRMEFEGKVDRIGTKGTNVQNVVTFEVRIELLSENKNLLKPEMTTNVTILIAENPDALLVPSAAVLRDRGATYVNVTTGGSEERRDVQVGLSDGMNTEITSGVKEGETVSFFKLEEESRWRSESGAQEKGRRDRMMMRTLGGGPGRR